MKPPKSPIRFLGYGTLAMVLLAAAVVLAPSESTQQVRTVDIDVDTVAAAARADHKDRAKTKSNGKRCETGTRCGKGKKRGKDVLRVTDNDLAVDASAETANSPEDDGTEPTDGASTDPTASDSETGNPDEGSATSTTPAGGGDDTTISQPMATSSLGDGVDDSTRTTDSDDSSRTTNADDSSRTTNSDDSLRTTDSDDSLRTTNADAEATMQSTTTVAVGSGDDDLTTSEGSVDQTTTSDQATTGQQPTTTRGTTAATESAPTTTTSSGGEDRSCCSEGYAGVHVDASSSFDKWTEGDEYWPFINANYDSMMVYASYWDSRLEHYDNVVVYRDVYAIYVDSSRATEHPEWILRERDGSPVYIPWGCSNGCPQYAADVSNPQFRQDFIGTLKDLVGRGYPGIMLDDVNLSWRFSDRYGNDAEPIDPATGQTMTLTAWQTYLVEFLEEIRRELPGVTIAHNSIWYVDSPRFDNPLVERQIRVADLIELERGATDSGLVDGTGRYGFQSFLNYVDRVHRAGGQVLLLDEDAESEDDLIFNLAATLLVNDGGDLVSTENWDYISPVSFWDGFKTDLGHAAGSRYLDAGLIRRDFTGGMVLLNEPDADPVRVNLNKPMRLLNGQQVTSFVLDGREAAILRPS